MTVRIEFIPLNGAKGMVWDFAVQPHFAVLPYSGSLKFSRSKDDEVKVNGNLISGELFSLDITDCDVEIQINHRKVNVEVLCQKPNQMTVGDYKTFAQKLPSCISSKDFERLFVESGKQNISLCHSPKEKSEKIFQKDFDLKSVVVHSQNMVHVFRQPRLHLKQITEIRSAALATRIGAESIRYLASHSEHWKGVTPTGLIPDKLLARVLDDDVAIYENLVARDLVDHLTTLFKFYESQTVDCLLQGEALINSQDVGYGKQQKNVYRAMSLLFQGIKDDENDKFKMELSNRHSQIQEILSNLAKCRSLPLYRQLRRKKIGPQSELKRTNIFMMDKNYRSVYQLWNMIHSDEEVQTFTEPVELENEYGEFCRMLLLFSLYFMEFKFVGEGGDICFFEHQLMHMRFRRFDKWQLTLKEISHPELDIPAIEATLSIPKKIKVKINDFGLPDKININEAEYENGFIIFDEKLSQQSINRLFDSLESQVEKKKWNYVKLNIRKRIIDAFNAHKESSQRILLIPWDYSLPDTPELLKKFFNSFNEIKTDVRYDAQYVLTLTRPNDLGQYCSADLISVLTSYGDTNKYLKKRNVPMGFVPISINDVNSFRRLQKIFLKHLVLLGDHDICPICQSKLYENSSCYECQYQIIETVCKDCRRKYLYTNYDLPKTIPKTFDEPGYNVLYNEIALDFLNITNASRSVNKKYKPICPYCGNE